MLVGFDFPFGYPVGAAAAIAGQARWDALWAWIAARIEDGPRNANNRFDVAAAINRDAFDGAGPFWGRPPTRDIQGLPAKKPDGYGARYPAERRAVERLATTAHPVWKLFTTGSVGSQALMGVAFLERLRRDPALGGDVAVWPFETGFAERLDAGVILTEIYPSLWPPDPREAVKDAGQVRAVAERFAAMADLRQLLTTATAIAPQQARDASEEEGWIVGL